MAEIDPERVLGGGLFESGDFQTRGGNANAPTGPAPSRVAGYEILGEIARGGMGLVLRARDPELRREVAIKLLLASRFESDGARERFRVEAESLARLSHPHVVRVHANGIDRGRPFLVMELIEGETLEARLNRGEVLAPEDAARLALQLAEALAHAHAHGVLHRDLKPANVILTPAGTPKLTDFGLARRLDSASRLSKPGQILGTPGFWAPEQLGGAAADVRTDVYGLGATLFAALTGEPPFDGQNLPQLIDQTLNHAPRRPSAVRPGPERRLDAICLRCLAKDPARRFSDADALARALRRYLNGSGTRARRVQWAAAVAIVGLVGGAAALITRPDPPGLTVSPTDIAEAAVPPLQQAREALDACLRAEYPTEEAIAAAEDALWSLSEAGDPVQLDRLTALREGPARLRLRTLAQLLLGQREQASQELAAAKGTLAAKLALLVDAGAQALTIELGTSRRGYGAPEQVETGQEPLVPRDFAIENLLRQVELAERLPADPELAGVRRWALPACQEGLATLAVIARDRALGVKRVTTRAGDWAERAIALAPESAACSVVRIGQVYVRSGPSVQIQPADRETVERALETKALPPLFEFLACTLLALMDEPRTETLVTALRLAREDPLLEMRYSRNVSQVRVRYARAEVQRAHAVLREGGDASVVVQQAYRAAWQAVVHNDEPPPEIDQLPEVLERSALNHPEGIKLLALVLLMARRSAAARVTVELILLDTDQQLKALLNAELRWIEQGPESAAEFLRQMTAYPKFESAQAWAALAHARSVVGDEAGAAEAAERAATCDRQVDVPWRSPTNLPKMLRGEAWWPGAG